MMDVPTQVPFRSGVLRAAFADPDRFYNAATRTIALEGPRGVLLAVYTQPSVRPDPAHHRFLAYYSEDYTPFKGDTVPATTRADVTAFCVPVDVSSDKRATVEAGAPDFNAETDASPSRGDFNVVTGGTTLADATGMSFRRHSVQLWVDGAGFQAAAGRVQFKGQTRLERPEGRGVTAQSPIWSVVPKTAVTFFAADMLPDLERVKKAGDMIRLMAHAVTLVASLVDLAVTLFDGGPWYGDGADGRAR